MRRALAAVALLVVGGVAAALAESDTAPATRAEPLPTTARVERGALSSLVTLSGTLTYRAQADGTPWTAVGQASGTFTALPAAGAAVRCGEVLLRVDDEPVVLLCGTVPLYRGLAPGAAGRDVRQLNRALRRYGAAAGSVFTARTERALRRLQRRRGLEVDGTLDRRDAVVLPSAARVAKVLGRLGGPARPGTPVVEATTDRLEVQVELEAAQQHEVRRGDHARVMLPDNRAVTGRVVRIGRVARAPEGAEPAAAATLPAAIGLDRRVRGLDRAPVRVEITTRGITDALSVPVTALLGHADGGFAVEVVRGGGRRELVAVRLGLFDTAGGRVAVEGAVRAGDAVVVPAS